MSILPEKEINSRRWSSRRAIARSASAAAVLAIAVAAAPWMAPAAHASERQPAVDNGHGSGGDTHVDAGSAEWRPTRTVLSQQATPRPTRRSGTIAKVSTASRGSGSVSNTQRRSAQWQPSRTRRFVAPEPSRPTTHGAIRLAQDTSKQADPFDELFDSPSSKSPSSSESTPSSQTPAPSETTPPSDELPAPSNQPDSSTTPDTGTSPGSSSEKSDLFSEEPPAPEQTHQPAPTEDRPMVVTPRTDRKNPFADDPSATDHSPDTHTTDEHTTDKHAVEDATTSKSPGTLQFDATGQPPAELPSPEPLADDQPRVKAQADCQEALDELQAEKIGDIVLSVSVQGKPGQDIPYECSLSDEPFEPRCWGETIYTWKASGLCHKPLYFEDVQLERYGHSWGPYVQPFVSGAHFFATLPILPYKMGLEPPDECIYVLGYYRPGNCAPYLIDPIPLSWRAALLEAGAAVGVSAVVP